MAEEFFRGKEPYTAGILLAFRRVLHRSAEDDSACWEEGFLIFLQKGENPPSLTEPPKRYRRLIPRRQEQIPSPGDNRISFPRDGWFLAGKRIFFMERALRVP